MCDHTLNAQAMHPASFYTLLDIGGSLWGTLVFASALLAPGYVLGQLTNLAHFRKKIPTEQLAWSLALSFGISPILIVAAVWIIGLAVTGYLLAAASALAVILFIRASIRPFIRPSRPGLGHLIVAVWIAFVILSLVDIGSGSRLWMSVTTFDHSIRTPFIDAVLRTGVPPVNPLYWPGHDTPLRYFYFWYVLCAVIAKLAHISARQALIASCVWPAAGVAAMLALYGRHWLSWQGIVLRRRWQLCLAAMAITGLDGLIALFVALSGQSAGADMEWWSVDQVTSWADTFLWVPHHAAALVCCLFALLLLQLSTAASDRRQRILHAVLAGLSFASAFGLSTYIALAFYGLAAIWLLREVIATRRSTLINTVAMASAVAAVVLFPYVFQLLHPSTTSASSPQVLSFEVRQMLDPSILDSTPGFRRLFDQHPLAAKQLSALVLLIPGYLIEFGFFAFALFLAFRLRQKTAAERTLLFLTIVSLLLVTFVRSAVIATNDYGIRAALLAQFFLLPLSVRAWESSRRASRIILASLACIGIGGSLYQVVLLRTYLPWQQLHGNSDMQALAERNAALRDAYDQLSAHIPANARIQYGAPEGGFFDSVHTLNAHHQLIAAGTTDRDCNTGFGGEISACAAIRQAGDTLFSAPNTLSSSAAAALCNNIGAQYLVVTRWDAIWPIATAWPYTLPAVVATSNVRIVACQAK